MWVNGRGAVEESRLFSPLVLVKFLDLDALKKVALGQGHKFRLVMELFDSYSFQRY